MDDASSESYTRSCRLNHRRFKALFDEIENVYVDIIHYFEIRFLSNRPQRSLSLLEEIRIFLIEIGPLLLHPEDTSSVCDQIFLTDICEHQNSLNSKPQGKYQLLNELYSTVSAFRKKLSLLNS
jgi:hypothetical protein